MQPVVVKFSNAMATGSYVRTMPPGDFSDLPINRFFVPYYTPCEMLTMGVFEGKYLNSCRDEYPAEWFRHARLSDVPNQKLNYFKLKSRESTTWWLERDLIRPQDTRGWFEWYCRFWMGRRTDDDERQILRWTMMIRHSAQVKKNGRGDINVRPRQRQTLLQWSWNPFPDFATEAVSGRPELPSVCRAT